MKTTAPTICACTVFTALALALMAGCGKKTPDNILARVGGENITVEDFQNELQHRTANRLPIPAREQLLEDMIARAALVQRAKNSGLDQAADVRRTLEDVLIAKVQERELEPKLAAVTVSPAEVSAAYDREVARFTQPAKVHLAIIYLAADAKTDTNRLAEISARAMEARQQALALPATEKSFGKVAADFSEDQSSRYRGGEAGWFTAGFLADRWPQEVLAAGLALPSIGDVSAVIRSADGFYLVKKMDARAATLAPLAQVRGGLERQLLIAKRESVAREFKAALRAAATVQTNVLLLGTVKYPDPKVPNPAGAVPPGLPNTP